VKLATFEVKTHLGKHRRLGAVTSAGIVDLNFACAARLGGNYRLADALVPADMLEFLRGGPQSMAAARDSLTDPLPPLGARDETIVYRPEQIRLLAPLPNPASVRDFYAFEDHVKKGFEKRGEPMPAEWYEIPVYYKSAHHNIIGTEADAPWPSFTDKFDYELELAAVIGKQGSNILAENASEYIAGYTVMNDFSARDIQRKEMKVRLGPAKGKDWCTALGPYLVTSEEIGDVYRLEMLARVNGEEWSRGNSCSIYWKFEQMIEFITRDDTIYPGDVLGSGTVGSGCGLELDRWVKRGDVIELEIEKLGVLRNRVT
jgi:2-keto-4-pentenoate hydratase/2-oxohepta-3-ene-1,7-dioic acid hydratase in catechol pathway